MKLNELDTIHVLNPSIEVSSSAFMRTYGVLIQAEAFFVFEFLKRTNTQSLSLKELCLNTGLNLSQFNQALDRLVQCEVIDIKVKKQNTNHLRLHFNHCLSIQEFCRHDVLGRQLLKKIGPEAFEKLKSESQDNLSNEGYDDYEIKASANIQSWTNEDEKQFKQEKIIRHKSENLSFDLIAFLNQCSDLVFPHHKRTEHAIAAISEIGSVYGLSVKQMIECVGKACAKNDATLNFDKLRKCAAKQEVEDMVEKDDPYDYPPSIFLKRLRKGIAATALEKYVLVRLVSEVGLKPEVLNVLIEAHFNQFRSKINTKVLEEVAMQWAVSNVYSKEEAFKKVNEFKSSKKRVEEKTDYSNKEINLSEAELKALEMALKEIK